MVFTCKEDLESEHGPYPVQRLDPEYGFSRKTNTGLCTECGTEISSDDTFCPKCGRIVSHDSDIRDEHRTNEPIMFSRNSLTDAREERPHTDGKQRTGIDSGEKRRMALTICSIALAALSLGAVLVLLFFMGGLSGLQNNRATAPAESEAVLAMNRENNSDAAFGNSTPESAGQNEPQPGLPPVDPGEQEELSLDELLAELESYRATVENQKETIDGLTDTVSDLEGQLSAHYIFHIVTAGETLYSVCEAMGIDYGENRLSILSMNRIIDENLIHPGQTLILPIP